MDDWGQLTAAEQRFLRTMFRRLTEGGAMIAGSYCEAVIAETLPGSVQPALGSHPWDLEWEGINIEVKMTRRRSWQVPERMLRDGKRERRRRAHVYVLATHEGDDHRGGWEFYVVPTSVLDERGKSSVTVRWVRERFDPVPLDVMPEAIRAAHAQPSRR